jgi:hypothetical protein
MLHLRPGHRARGRVGRADAQREPGGNIRVAKQIVVEVLAVAPEYARELVALGLREVQLAEGEWIAAEAVARRLSARKCFVPGTAFISKVSPSTRGPDCRLTSVLYMALLPDVLTRCPPRSTL